MFIEIFPNLEVFLLIFNVKDIGTIITHFMAAGLPFYAQNCLLD